MIDSRTLKHLDLTFVFIVISIMIVGLIAIYSANVATAGAGQDPYNFVKKQLLWIFLGSILAIFLLSFDYEDLGRYVNHLYIANLVILSSVLLFGQEALGAQRWINIGPFQFQPSEFGKIIMIITYAHFLSKRKDNLQNFWQLIPAFMYVGFPMLLILKQPDLGTSLVFIAIMFGMLIIASGNPWLVGGIFVGGISTAILWVYLHFNFGLWVPLEDYQLTRLVIFLDPSTDPWGSGYHIIQSLVAIGSAEFWGKGFLHGTQNQLNFLPEQHTDFIFSVIGEEFGFIGGFILLFLFFLLVYRAIKIAAKAKDLFGTLIVVGIISMFVFQILINVGMTIAIMPVTGKTLPLVSYGGSSMLANLLGIGLILNVNVSKRQLTF